MVTERSIVSKKSVQNQKEHQEFTGVCYHTLLLVTSLVALVKPVFSRYTSHLHTGVIGSEKICDSDNCRQLKYSHSKLESDIHLLLVPL